MRAPQASIQKKPTAFQLHILQLFPSAVLQRYLRLRERAITPFSNELINRIVGSPQRLSLPDLPFSLLATRSMKQLKQNRLPPEISRKSKSTGITPSHLPYDHAIGAACLLLRRPRTLFGGSLCQGEPTGFLHQPIRKRRYTN